MERYLGVATLTSKGQVTLPKVIREMLKLNQGDQIIFDMEEGSDMIVIHKGKSVNRGDKLTALLVDYDSGEAADKFKEGSLDDALLGKEIL